MTFKEFIKPTKAKINITIIILMIILLLLWFHLFFTHALEGVSSIDLSAEQYQRCCSDELIKPAQVNYTKMLCDELNLTSPDSCQQFNNTLTQSLEEMKQYVKKQKLNQFIYFIVTVISSYLFSCTIVYLYEKIKQRKS